MGVPLRRYSIEPSGAGRRPGRECHGCLGGLPCLSKFLCPAAPAAFAPPPASVFGGTEAPTAQLAKTVSVHSHDIIMLHCYDTSSPLEL